MLFWNVANLFEAGAVPRGPQSDAEVDAKINTIASEVDGAFGAEPPDLIGLAEVGNDQLFGEIEARLREEYVRIWEPAFRQDQTGLGVLARKTVFGDVELVATCRHTMMQRPRSIVIDCELLSNGDRFLFSVNHWKSRMVHSGDAFSPGEDRGQTADWLGELLASSDRRDCAVVVGDFNAEPCEDAFGEFKLRSRRHFTGALFGGATPAYLYNTAWRSMDEPHIWEDRVQAGNDYRDRRPKTSHDASPGVIFDQLLVSGAALRNGPLTLRERSVRYHYANNPVARHTGGGYLKPRRWEWDAGQNTGSGASDHFALLAEFDAN
jgi:endonuclease/exonuclease/phosphatase family metal-dependent hydrolase